MPPDTSKACVWNGVSYRSVTVAAQAQTPPISVAAMSARLRRGYTCDADMVGTGLHLRKPTVWNGIDYPSLSIAAAAHGLAISVLAYRIKKGYTCDAAMPKHAPTPSGQPPRHGQSISCVWNGVRYPSISAAARANFYSPSALRIRMLKGETGAHNDSPSVVIYAGETHAIKFGALSELTAASDLHNAE